MHKIMFYVGLFFCLFPLVSRGVEKYHQKDVIAVYEEKVKNTEDRRLEEAIRAAEQYNRNMHQLRGIVVQSGSLLEEEENYENQLNVFGNEIMGSVRIPKISVNLPIYHGTEEEVLSAGVGHLRESSLPVGGESTHSVLTGHRGLPTSQLFTRLDEMEEGDFFFIHIYNRILAYRVCEIQVVSPEDSEILEVEEGKDKVSLVTCTPYGINTHRLVVTGTRTPCRIAEFEGIRREHMSWREMLFMMMPFLFTGISAAGRVRKRRKVSVRRKRRAGRAGNDSSDSYMYDSGIGRRAYSEKYRRN